MRLVHPFTFAFLFGGPVAAAAQEPAQDSVTIRLVNTELRSAVQVMAQYLDRPVIFSGPGGTQITLETPQPVPRANVLRLLRGLLESQNYELVEDSAGGLYRARQRVEQRPAPPPVDPAVLAAQRQAGTPELFVIPLKHARAADVATTVNALYGRDVSFGADGRQQTIGDELRSNLMPPAPSLVAPPSAGAPRGNSLRSGITPGLQPGASAGTRPAALTGDITIVPDSRVNSLLIRSNRNDYELIRAVVEQLDIPPLQVLIEAVVVEATRDRALHVNSETKLGETAINDIGTTISGVLGTPGLGDFALKVMNIAGIDLETTLRVASSRGNVRIVSRPVVLTENSHLATIVVGSQRPFVQLARALPTDNAVRDQVVQYKEVGTKLSVRPTISSDGSVQLEVTQEVSTATGETQFDAPVISQRSVQTQLLVRDGQTVVLGGLTDRQRTVSSGGIPILSSIPWLGGLFGRQSRETRETELFVFLTPRVIRTAEDADRLSQPMRDRAEKVKP
jgi:general secretion pathway protein D